MAAQLTETYRPARIEDFCGLAKVKQGLLAFVADPYSESFIFKGDSGTGKSSMARIVAQSIGAELTHVPSQECTVDRLRAVVQSCHYAPMFGCKFHCVLVDEADSMSKAARDYLLSALDELPPFTVFIFTCNSVEAFESRFMSRSIVLDFSNYGIQADATKLLSRIWEESKPGKPAPNVARIIKEASGNVRAALKALQWEMKLA